VQGEKNGYKVQGTSDRKDKDRRSEIGDLKDSGRRAEVGKQKAKLKKAGKVTEIGNQILAESVFSAS